MLEVVSPKSKFSEYEIGEMETIAEMTNREIHIPPTAYCGILMGQRIHEARGGK